MAAAAILNLLLLSILVKWSISRPWQPSTLLQNFIHLRQSAAELMLFVHVCETSNVIYAPNFVQIRAIINEL